MSRCILFLLFSLQCANVFTQVKNAEKNELRREIRELLKTCELLEYNKPEKFKDSYDNELYNDCTIGQPHFSEVFNKTVFKVESRDSSTFQQDLFYFRESGNKVLYASETKLYIYENDTITWKCEYFFDKGKLVDWESLGYGNTESDDWKPESIIEKFQNYLEEYQE